MKDTITLNSDTYFGGKGGAGMYQTIINQIPPHRGFLSGCLGHCAIMRKKLPAEYNIGCDPDPDVIQVWKDANAEKLLNMRLWNGCIQDYNIQINLAAIGGHQFNLDDWFIYLDPPYPLDSINGKSRYNFKMSDEQHIELLELIKDLPIKIAISTYPNKLYRRYLREWRCLEFKAKTRQRIATELLYMNYPEPTDLHDYRYLGKNFKEREHIKLKFERWKNNLHQLPPLEVSMRKNYILSKL